MPERGTPAVTVLMPVHNGARHLREAIASVLAQTFTDLELLVIDDGSTDEGPSIIAALDDPRVRVVRHDRNQGLIASLNEGLDLAAGRYIARMDADDVMHPERLAKQHRFLQEHPDIAVLATFVDLIDADGAPSGTWDTDRQAVTEADIRRMMARTNCIAHPSVMIDKRALDGLRYSPAQRGAEDWDLWMRLLARGRRIAKLPEPLLRYRIHAGSIMGGEKKAPLEVRLMRARGRSLRGLRPSAFAALVVVAQLRTFARHLQRNVLPRLARAVYRAFTYSPLALLRERRALREALSGWQGRHVFLFSYLNTGGAEQVHADIMATVADQRPLILITGFSKDRAFAQRFAELGTLLETPRLLHHPFTAAATRRRLIERINAVERPVVLGANTDHFFGLLPALKRTTRAIFLQHAFLYQPEGNAKHKQWVHAFDRVERYVFVSRRAMEEFKLFLASQHVPASRFGKLVFISNAVHAFPAMQEHDSLGVLFVGRDSPEKRLPLFLEVVQRLEERMPGRYRATVVGAGPRAGHPTVTFKGTVNDPKELSEVYAQHDVLLLTSTREGFPMVIMEAMAHGLVVFATPVGDIPDRLTGPYGLVTTASDPAVVKEEMAAGALALAGDKALLRSRRQAAQDQARREFDPTLFRERYRALLMAPEAWSSSERTNTSQSSTDS